MFKLIKRLIVIVLIAGIVLIAISFWKGGEPFRWFGKKSEKAGEVIKEKSEEIGKEADKIKKKTEKVKDTTKKVTENIRKTGEKIKDIGGSKTEK